MARINETRMQELLEKAMDFLNNRGMIEEFEEEYDLDLTEEEKDYFCLYPSEMDDEEIWTVINQPSRMEIATDEELEKELRSFDSSAWFEEEDANV